MLSFTYQDKPSRHQHSIGEPDFQPIIFSNSPPSKNKPMANPKAVHKKLVKTNSYSTNKPINAKTSQKRVKENPVWDTHANNRGLFDEQLKKDSLATQERRIRSAAKQKSEPVSDSRAQKLVGNEYQLQQKKLGLLSSQKDREIEELRKAIEQERLEKEKSDQVYAAKKRQIELERKKLIELERQIQREGPKAKREVREKLNTLSPHNYPGNDRAKCHQDQQQQPRPGDHNKFNEITQSESISNQRNMLRQHQIEYLVKQRERNHFEYQRSTLGYTPTLIPLLSRASYKIISTHVSSLVELLIDDLLHEHVHLLQAIEMETKAEQQRNKEKQVLHDYIRNLDTFVGEIQEVEDKLGKYSQMKFEDIYINRNKSIDSTPHPFQYTPHLYCSLQLGFSRDQMEELVSRTDRFRRFVGNFKEYQSQEMKAFSDTTEQIIDEMILKLTHELDKGSGEFVDIVFRNEFE